MARSSRQTKTIAFALTAITIVICLISPLVELQPAPAITTPAPWVARSNQNARVLLAAFASLNPEGAADLGVEGLDEQIIDLKPGFIDRRKQAARKAAQVLEGRLANEKDPHVRQDLEILIRAARNDLRETELEEKYKIPYINVAQLIFGGVNTLLDDQVSTQRRSIALVRLKRYTGVEPGYIPLTTLAEQHTRERLNQPGLIGPPKARVEKDLANTALLIDSIGKLFEKYHINGYQKAYAKLKEQLAAYDTFVRQEILPRARIDFRQPSELYAFTVEQVGIDVPPEQLAAQAHAAFKSIQQQMQALAPQVAKAKGFSVTDYHDVIRALKQDQLVPQMLVPHYQKRIQELEAIIRREHLVTLPSHPLRFRLATAAESASLPAPHYQPPRLLGNTGQLGEFVLPLTNNSQPGLTQKFDDFTFPAASWTLTAHEGRPGHDLQFTTMLEKGVSEARAIFAFNSVNVEGWALYAETIAKPYMPPEGQLIGLQFQLLRAARAFLDPELQTGQMKPEEALRVLQEDVMFSNAFANEEIDRYTIRSPGQAMSYFYGYIKLLALREEVERTLGKKFNQQKFHDFILAQGLLPPGLLRQVVLQEFISSASKT
ncbi:MAG: DUF885 domain-containing protein [Chroococcidiopsidaceae cyanobacterium CP_BM_ER_R8_30]|nr:DUF885 domain-containing protein [Chroococcidiopsidaceae cyanobacterium CP_BM_ER_R8_30]